MRTYEARFKNEAVKLSGEVGSTKAARELGMPQGTLNTWIAKAKNGSLPGVPTTPKAALTLAEENKQLRQELREIKRTNEILSKATAFFASSRKK